MTTTPAPESDTGPIRLDHTDAFLWWTLQAALAAKMVPERMVDLDQPWERD